MSDPPRAADLPALVERGLAMVDARRGASDWPIYDSIRAQLRYMQQTLESGQPPEQEKVNRLLLGVYAAREFETTDPEFADVLFAVEYLFKRVGREDPGE